MPRPMEQVCFAGLFFFYAFASLFFFTIIFRFGKKQQMKGICRNTSSLTRQRDLKFVLKNGIQVLQKPYSGDVYERDAPRHLQGVLFSVTLAVSVFLHRLRFFAQCAMRGCRNFSEAAAANALCRAGASAFCAAPCARGGGVLARCRYKCKPRSALCVGLSNVSQCSEPKDGGIGKRTDIFTRGLMFLCE